MTGDSSAESRIKKNKLGTWCLDQFALLRGGIILGESSKKSEALFT